MVYELREEFCAIYEQLAATQEKITTMADRPGGRRRDASPEELSIAGERGVAAGTATATRCCRFGQSLQEYSGCAASFRFHWLHVRMDVPVAVSVVHCTLTHMAYSPRGSGFAYRYFCFGMLPPGEFVVPFVRPGGECFVARYNLATRWRCV